MLPADFSFNVSKAVGNIRLASTKSEAIQLLFDIQDSYHARGNACEVKQFQSIVDSLEHLEEGSVIEFLRKRLAILPQCGVIGGAIRGRKENVVPDPCSGSVCRPAIHSVPGQALPLRENGDSVRGTRQYFVPDAYAGSLLPLQRVAFDSRPAGWTLSQQGFALGSGFGFWSHEMGPPFVGCEGEARFAQMPGIGGAWPPSQSESNLHPATWQLLLPTRRHF